MRIEDLEGRRLGRYEIVETIGRGGMAAVYRAHDTVLRRDVALKILYPQYTGDIALVERFQREAVLAAGLDHPNILPIYDVGEHDGLVYIAMRLLGGQSFADILRLRGSLPATELLPIVDQIASALDYAHARQIVHRDIKPANILIESPYPGNPAGSLAGARAILTDFGIAKSLDPAASGLTVTGVLIGTPEYMAPEQIRGGHSVDGRADVYALGVLVYRALTGRRPFDGSTEEVLLGHLGGQVPAPSSLDPRLAPALSAVILKALARGPSERYQSAGEFARALRSAAGLELPTPPPALRRDTDGRALVPGVAVGQLGRNSPPTNSQPTRQGNAAPPYAAHSRGATSAQPTRQGNAAPPYARPNARAAAPERARRTGSNIAWALLGVLLALVIGGGVFFTAQLLANRRDNGGPVVVIPTDTPTLPAPTAQPTAQPTAAPSATAVPTEEAPTATAQPTQTPAPTARPQPTPTKPPVIKPTAAPTSTPTELPPATPTSEPTPTDTPTVVPSPTPCLDETAPEFASLLDKQVEIQAALGCATQAAQSRPIAEQNFERGAMIWVAGPNGRNGTIYVIIDNEASGQNRWQVFEDTWQEGDPVDSGDETPPPGRYEPLRGFGKLWYANKDVASMVGWAKDEHEAGGTGVIQRFANGRMLHSSLGFGAGPSIYVMYQEGMFSVFKAPS